MYWFRLTLVLHPHMCRLIVLSKTMVAVHCCKEKKCRNRMLHHVLFLHRFSSSFSASWAKCTNILHVHTTLYSWFILGCTHMFHIPFWGIGTINCMTIKCYLNTRIQIRVRFRQHVSEFECHFPGPMLLLSCLDSLESVRNSCSCSRMWWDVIDTSNSTTVSYHSRMQPLVWMFGRLYIIMVCIEQVLLGLNGVYYERAWSCLLLTNLSGYYVAKLVCSSSL